MKVLLRNLLCLLIILPGLSFAQDLQPAPAHPPPAQEDGAGPDRASPRGTMLTFITAMNKTTTDTAAWSVAVDCLDFSGAHFSDPEKREVAVYLFGILNRIEHVEPYYLWGPDKLTDDKKLFTYFPHPVRHRHITLLVGESYKIEIERVGGDTWLFSRSTVNGLPALYDELKGQEVLYGKDEIALNPSMWLRSRMPDGVKREILTIELWQIIGLFLMIFAGVALDHIVRFISTQISHRIIKDQGASAKSETIDRVVRPLGLLASALFWLLILRLLGFTGLAESILTGAAQVFATIAVAFAIWRGIDLVAEVVASKAVGTETKVDDVLVPLVRKAAKIFVAIMGILYVANKLDVQLAPFLASLGLGGLAFAFAAKDTVENFFGSIAVILDRPFHVGDWIVVGDVEGTVEEIGFRSTRVRTFYNSQVTVANATLVRATVDNYGRRKYRRWKCHLGIEYGAPPETVLAFCEGIRELVRLHPYTRKDYYQVYLNQFSAASLDILLYIFFKTPDWSTELRERERLMLDIIRLADRFGIGFAYDTQTVHLFQGDETAASPGFSAPHASSDSEALATGSEEARNIVKDQHWQTEKPGKVSYRVPNKTKAAAKITKKAPAKRRRRKKT